LSRGRPVRRLDAEEVRAYLASKPGWAILTSYGRDGYPHSVPLGYFMAGDDIVLGTLKGTQKLRNIERDPRVSVVVESSEGSRLIGVMLTGHAELVLDPAARLELQREAARQRGAEPPTEARPEGAYIRLRPRRVVSWHFE
jgi:PPOX class probable F420-dependent enzyme